MANLGEGFRRTAIVVASFCCMAWLIRAVLELGRVDRVAVFHVAVIVVGALITYAVPWALIRAIGWAAAGFRARTNDR